MSATVDTNILLYAANADDQSHEVARDLLERLAGGTDLFYLFWPTIMGFLRISTHPAIFTSPYSPAQATSAITGLLRRPNVRAPSEQEGFWDIYAATADNQTRGNHVPDAHLAALMRQHGVRIIYSRDRDLHRYEAIDVRDPFT